jgi:hypothetical protein
MNEDLPEYGGPIIATLSLIFFCIDKKNNDYTTHYLYCY